MFKPIQVAAATAGQSQSEIDEPGIKRVFMVLHGFYGNLFLSKFSTGSADENGEDQGIANARWVWAHGLQPFDADTVKLALRRCQTQHPEFPPSLPQFVALCDAARPREVSRAVHPDYTPALSMSPELRARRRAEARAAATEAAHRKLEAEQPRGLDLLKQSIAQAVADAGGDEAAMLLQLDRIFAPRSAA